MASRDYRTASVAGLSALETNKVLKNTYLLLSATLGFSAVMAGAVYVNGDALWRLNDLSDCLHGTGYVCFTANSSILARVWA